MNVYKRLIEMMRILEYNEEKQTNKRNMRSENTSREEKRKLKETCGNIIVEGRSKK